LSTAQSKIAFITRKEINMTEKETKTFQEFNASAIATLLGVPVGSILPFIGALDQLPDNWQLCDGRHISDPQSPFNGTNLPNLTDDRFLMGVAPGSPGLKQNGGSNLIQPDGSHNHGGATGGLSHYDWGAINYDRQGEHWDQFQMRMVIGVDGQHSHGGDKRPAFFGVLYIIRIK
jgi:hypothetical protein